VHYLTIDICVVMVTKILRTRNFDVMSLLSIFIQILNFIRNIFNFIFNNNFKFDYILFVQLYGNSH
jgi:hypothetical protein